MEYTIVFIVAIIASVSFFIILYISIKKESMSLLLSSYVLLGIAITCCNCLSNRNNNKINDSNMKEDVKSTFIDLEKEYKDYDRKFIRINPNEIMLIHMFKRDACHQLEDMVLDDNEQYFLDVSKIRKDAAHQLMLQFEGHQCRAFIEALKQECDKWIEEDDKWMVEMDNKLKNKRK